MKPGRRGLWVVPACGLLAMLLSIAPLPDMVDWLRPSFPMLVVIFWAVALPARFGTWGAWWLGIAMDILRDVPLGAHALAFAVIAWAATQLTSRMKVYPPLQQVTVVALLAGVGIVLERMAFGLTGAAMPALLPALAPVFTTAILWPWAAALQERLRRFAGAG